MAAGTRFTELRDRATKAFKAKRYKEACALYTEAQAAQPADAANMADLALCLQRAGDVDGAVKANQDAIRLASAPGAPAGKSLRVRKAAYYNLGRLDWSIGVPRGSGGKAACDDLIEDGAGCKRPVHICARGGTTGGVRHLTDFVAARFALDEASARLGDNEYRIDWPGMGDGGQASDQTDGDTYDVSIELSTELRDENGETYATSSGGCTLVHADGCTGHFGFACTWQESNDGKPQRTAVEMTLRP